MADIVIYQPWGGLGDNLGHALIPELCQQTGHRCFLSKHNAYRNQQIYDLVWGYNPFIQKETIDSKDLSWLDRCKFFENKGLSHVQVIQKAYGFVNSQIEYPKIYYTPKFLPEFKNKTIIDFNSISVPYNTNILQRCLKDLLLSKNITENIIVVKHSKLENTNYNLPIQVDTLDINDLFLYSDIIFSAKNIITLNSGITNLSSTIKDQYKSDVQLHTFTYRKYMKEYGSNGYFYSNNNYIPVD